ncbi:zinc transporter ZIP11 [Cydia fagiglandana]|uniref:zinc transporter ZIP11 n=1 Tax=Cydia fagiglandana TaxID=1458189 RepID=UPI002FEE1EFD
MIEGYGAVTQALLGTLLTWGLTAAGASLVFFVRGKQRKLLDVSLGFAAGVMTAASYWSLLDPAITLCEKQGIYGKYSFLPVAAGFLLGAVFVFGTDVFLDYLGLNSTNMMMSITKTKEGKEKIEDLEMMTALNRPPVPTSVVTLDPVQPTDFADCINSQHSAQRRRHHHSQHSLSKPTENGEGDRRDSLQRSLEARQSQWKRIMLLVVAITVHNIPEGLAVGVSFGAAAASDDVANSFHVARTLALGIGIQNFPEGLAVSLPLQAAGFSTWRAFWYGQLSGMVEPVFGVLGAVAVAAAEPALPYALAFAAGAMIYVVADDIIPEANASGNGKLATWGCIAGFMVMMCLDVGLG